MTTLKQMIEAASALPPEDRRRLREWLQEQEQQDAEQPQPADTTTPHSSAETPQQQMERFRRAMQWIDEHRAEYLGQWVALEGDRLISHGADALQVDAAARATGIAAPFVVRVLEEPKFFYSGW